MSFAIFRYLTNWSSILFLLWYFGNDKIKSYLPIELLVLVVYYGFLVIYLMYHILYKNQSFNLLFFIGNLLFHYIPYKIVLNHSTINTKSVLFFVLISCIYMFYLNYHNQNVIQVYFYDSKLT